MNTMSKFTLSAFADEIDPDLQIQMNVLEECSIKFIEMRSINGKNITEYTLDEVKEIKSQLDERGFRISAVGSPIGKIKITDEFEPHFELFKHTIEIAKILDTQYIRMFSFLIPEDDDPKIYREEVLIRWQKFINAAEGTGIVLLHENEKGIYGDTAIRCLDLLEALNCNYVKAIFDPANFVQCNVQTYPEAYELLKDYIVYLHIKEAVYSDLHVTPAGMGDGRVREILSELHTKGFAGFLSIEPHLSENLPFEDPGLFKIAYDALIKILYKIN
jgi:sugar phosphate isomerase/epimerase